MPALTSRILFIQEMIYNHHLSFSNLKYFKTFLNHITSVDNLFESNLLNYLTDVGISSFRNHPSNVTRVIDSCIEKFALNKIPKRSRHNTPVFVGATAGMRLLW